MTTITVLDKGSTEEPNDPPVRIKMAAVDAHHAVAADPERYEIVEREKMTRAPGSDNDRFAAIEARLDALEHPESDEAEAA